MGSGGVAIAALPTVICLKVPFSDGLGGGIAHGVTRIIKDRYKAFQRCFRASLEGFVVYIGSMTNVIKAIQNCTLPHNCGSYLLYQET